MTGNPHPFKQPYDDRDAAALLGATKERLILTCADADTVRNEDLSGQFGNIFVNATGSTYKIDTEDTSTDDGVNVIIDGAGNHFVKVSINTDLTQRVVTASGAITVVDSDDIIIVKKTVGAPTTVNVDWSTRTKALKVVDGKGDANTNNISIAPGAGQTQYGIVDYVVVIDGNGGQVTLTPLADQTGAF